MHEKEAGIQSLNLLDSARQTQIRQEVISFAKELVEDESFFSFHSVMQIREKQSSLLKMVRHLTASLNLYRVKDGNYRGALFKACDALWGIEFKTLEEIAARYSFFDSVEKSVSDFQSKTEEQLAKQAPEIPKDQRQNLAEFIVGQLAQKSAYAASFANYQDRLKYRLNPFGICLKIHQLGAWNLGFIDEKNSWGILEERFFAVFPVIFSTISSKTHLSENIKRLYAFKVNAEGKVSGSFLDLDQLKNPICRFSALLKF